MKMVFRLLAAVALCFGISSAFAAQLPLLSGPQDPSQLQSTINTEIILMNAAYGAAGSGNVNTAISVPVVTNPVDLLTITPSATGNPAFVTLTATGSDSNISLGLGSKGSGGVFLGGSTQANATIQVVAASAAVNQFVVTSAATGGIPSLVVGGSGADANASLAIAANGTGTDLIGGATTTLAGLQVAQTASRVNDVCVTPAATGTAAAVAECGAGADTNRAFQLSALGTGNVIVSSGTGGFQVGGSAAVAANSNVATVLGSLGPTGSHTTVQEWLVWADNAGTLRFSPGF